MQPGIFGFIFPFGWLMDITKDFIYNIRNLCYSYIMITLNTNRDHWEIYFEIEWWSGKDCVNILMYLRFTGGYAFKFP